MKKLKVSILLILTTFFLAIPISMGNTPSFYVQTEDLLIYTYESVYSSSNKTQTLRETWKYEIVEDTTTVIQINITKCTLTSSQTEINCIIQNELDEYKKELNYSATIGQIILPLNSDNLDFISYSNELNDSLFLTWNLETAVININAVLIEISGITYSNETLNVIYEYDTHGVLQIFEMTKVGGENQTYVNLDLDDSRSMVHGRIYAALTIQNWGILVLFTVILIAFFGVFWQNRKKYSLIAIILSFIAIIWVYIQLMNGMIRYRLILISQPYIYIPLIIIMGYYFIKSGESPQTKYKAQISSQNNYAEKMDRESHNSSRSKRATSKTTDYSLFETNSDHKPVEEIEPPTIQFDMKKEMQRFEEMRFTQEKQIYQSKMNPNQNDVREIQEIIVPEEEFTLDDITYLPLDIIDSIEDSKLGPLSPEEQELLRLGLAFVHQLKSSNQASEKAEPIHSPANQYNNLREEILSVKQKMELIGSALTSQISHRIFIIKTILPSSDDGSIQISIIDRTPLESSIKNIYSVWEWTYGLKMQKFLPVFTYGANLIVNINDNQTQLDFVQIQEKLTEMPKQIPFQTIEIIGEIIHKIAESSVIIKGSELVDLIAFVVDIPRSEILSELQTYIKALPIIWLEPVDLVIMQPMLIAEKINSLISSLNLSASENEIQMSPEQWQQLTINMHISELEGVYLLQILTGFHLIEFKDEKNPIIRFLVK